MKSVLLEICKRLGKLLCKALIYTGSLALMGTFFILSMMFLESDHPSAKVTENILEYCAYTIIVIFAITVLVSGINYMIIEPIKIHKDNNK